MGRNAAFSDEQILAAATTHVAQAGPRASVATLAKLLGAPSGSIYYRFPSRDALIATVWLRAVREFQRGFLGALDEPDVDAAAAAASTFVPRWCGRSLDEAIVLHRYRLEDLVGAWPEALTPDRNTLNHDLMVALRDHARRRYGSSRGVALERTRFALVDLPGASVRRYLDRGEAPPAWCVEAVGIAALAVLRTDPGGSR